MAWKDNFSFNKSHIFPFIPRIIAYCTIITIYLLVFLHYIPILLSFGEISHKKRHLR